MTKLKTDASLLQAGVSRSTGVIIENYKNTNLEDLPNYW